MRNHDFNTLWGAAIVTPDRDIFVSEWATSSIWNENPEDLSDKDLLRIADYCGNLWDAAHMSVRQIKDAADMTQAQLAERFCVPRRTIENWCVDGSKEGRSCPDYIRLMMMEALGIISRSIQ